MKIDKIESEEKLSRVWPFKTFKVSTVSIMGYQGSDALVKLF